MKDKLGGKIITKFVGLRSKTYSYLKDNNDEGKKTKGAKGCVVKRKLKFKDYKNWLKSSQIISTVNYLEKKGINVDSFKQDRKEFIKNQLLLKSQQRFKSERHIGFTVEINKIALSSNEDKRIQSIDSTETYAHGMSKVSYGREKRIRG